MAYDQDINCLSVKFEEGGITSSYITCWSSTVPDGWDPEVVDGALPKSLVSSARAWRTCKYFVKGMPAICKFFDKTLRKCIQPDQSGGTESGKFLPTGYNNGKCDYLGRQTICNRYQAHGLDNLDEYICILPNMFLSGVCKKVDNTDQPLFRSISVDEIKGYNADTDGVGRCDCYGMGRGQAGCEKVGQLTSDIGAVGAEVELLKLPVVCNFYRPFSMGLGATAPHDVRLADGSLDLFRLTEMVEKGEGFSYRLPFSFEVFNLRARFQQCLWYESEVPGVFTIDDMGFVRLDNDNAFNTQNVLINCKCPDIRSFPYKTRDTINYPKTIMANVWAKAGTVICNGAKPECPCYTGKWYYCVDEKMVDGMPVTAQQIMELRFWSYDWDSQEEYDKYFSERPNPDDTSRPEIFTFTKWVQLIDEDFSVMEGKKVSLCQPAPLHMKEFIPDQYLKVEHVVYSKFGTDSHLAGQASFSNLVRDPVFPLIKPLTVVYPYALEEIFNEKVCQRDSEKTFCRKKTNEIYADFIYVIGQTIVNKKVYVINMTGVNKKPFLVVNNFNNFNMTSAQRFKLKLELDDYIRFVNKQHSDFFRFGFSNYENGVFIIDPIKLLPGKNELLIVVDFGGGEFNFKKRVVESIWCGGVAVQTSYINDLTNVRSAEFSQPKKIDPPAIIEANVLPLGGSRSVECVPARSVLIPLNFTFQPFYSYSLYWENVYNEKIIKACSVGNSGYIWCEIDNLELNMLFDFEVIKAEAFIKIKNSGLSEESIVVELQRVILDRKFLPPNGVLFKFKNINAQRFRYFPNSCEVFITYRYKKFIYGPAPSGKELIFGANNSNFKPVEYSYVLSGGNLKISNISKDTVSFLFLFKDEYGRLVSSVATKFLPYICRASCRNVEIRYRYQADGKQYVLTPERGFCVRIRADRLTGKFISHISDPICGDHLVGWSGRGPLWFPFSKCLLYDFYDVFTFANGCTAPLDIGPRNKGLICSSCGPAGAALRLDHRYRGPDLYQASTEPRGNWLASCNCGWTFFYSKASASPVFTGYGNIVGVVDEKYYAANGWRLPPFGNEGRELVERYLSQDYIYFYSFKTVIPQSEWAPIVFDNSMFYLGFDAFAKNVATYDLDFSGVMSSSYLDNFKHVNQLNFLVYPAVNEIIQHNDRKRFEDVFIVVSRGNCIYPPPPREATYTSAVSFYIFKDEDTVWAWQELWKEIDRLFISSFYERLDFILQYERPPYIWSLLKEEIRLICDEGVHEIVYDGPVVSDSSPTELETYPSVSLDGVHKKYFEIIYGRPNSDGYWFYDEAIYNADSVEWKIEGASGKVGGSSSDATNIYEDCFGGDWVFSLDSRFKNMLFDGTAEVGDAARDFYAPDAFGNYKKLKYNTGLIVKIPKNRLEYLPKDISEHSFSISEHKIYSEYYEVDLFVPSEIPDSVKLPGFCYNASINIFCQTESPEPISRLVIKGKCGKFNNVHYVIPGVSVVGKSLDGQPNFSPRGLSASSAEPKFGSLKNLEDYELIFDFSLSPIEMIKKPFIDFTISIFCPVGFFINIAELSVFSARYKSSAVEKIYVWERKYICSKGSFQWKNVDGPSNLLTYKDGGGVHFNYALYPNDKIITQNKMRGVFADTPFMGLDQREKLSITTDNLFDIEANKQRFLYEKALHLDPYSPNFIYQTICPPSLTIFLERLGRSFVGFGSSVFRAPLLSWEQLKIAQELLQTEFWRTGGHYYKWTDWFQNLMCGFGGTRTVTIVYVDDVYNGEFVHVDHGGHSLGWFGDSSTPVDPGNSYYSLRFFYQEARLRNFELLTGQQPDGGFDIVGPANQAAFIRGDIRNR